MGTVAARQQRPVDGSHGKEKKMGFKGVDRSSVAVSSESLVSEHRMSDDQPLPLVVIPGADGVELATWISGHRAELEQRLSVEGGILFRGFGADTPERFAETAQAFGYELLSYTERTAPRVELRPHVYTSTIHPESQYIHFHNANSYSNRWPMKIWFGCIVAAEQDGRTPIADCRKIYESVDPDVRNEFERRGVMYLRNFRAHVGLSWEETFQTKDPDVVRAYCAREGIEIELFEGDRLRTRQVRQAAARHPTTGVKVWFNQAHLFHLSGLDPEIQRVLTQTYAEEDLPRNAYFGDGGALDPAALAHIVSCYRDAEVSFDWEPGDFLVLDNMLVAHSRTSYKGERLVVVSFADPIDGRALATGPGVS
jgi:alpha-ketoglutarate-dependent taurine dioxygenase